MNIKEILREFIDSSPMARRILRLAVAPVVLPHELAHAAAALAVGLTPEVRLLPPHEGSTTPLGQFDADLPASTPTWRVRLGALHEGVEEARSAGDPGTEVVFAAEPWKHMHTALGPWIDGVAGASVGVK